MQVRQYGCALLGDIVKAAKEYLRPYAVQLIQILIGCLHCDPKIIDTQFTICNNSCWTMGEMAIAYPELVPQYAGLAMSSFVKLLDTETVQPPLLNC